MLGSLRRSTRQALNRFGYDVVSTRPASDAYLINKLRPIRSHIMSLDPETREFLGFCSERLDGSHSQIMQDLFVLYVLKEKHGGYFVDFGATDGIELSNSLLLERSYDWSGIVAEPARAWREVLPENRGCAVDFDCVSERSGETVVFNEVAGLGLSTIDSFTHSDQHAPARQAGERYEVQTISLNDLLARHQAPAPIDYLSIDTEGSEFSILSTFDFARYRPGIITVEHNFIDAKRLALFNLLTRNGYRRRFEQISMFDDWYVHERCLTDG